MKLDRLAFSFFTIAVAVVIICGCSRGVTTAKDPAVARSLLDLIYTGSLHSIQDQLATPIQRAMSDWITTGTAAAIQRDYGRHRNLTLVSVEKERRGSAIAVWTVEAEHGVYQMQVSFDGQSKVVGLWFRPTEAQQWTPSHILGQQYHEQQRR